MSDRFLTRPSCVFVVGGASLEAAVLDSDEPVCELAQRGVMTDVSGAHGTAIAALLGVQIPPGRALTGPPSKNRQTAARRTPRTTEDWESTMTYAVTGASGHLGHHAAASLLTRGVPGEQVLALARNPTKVGDFLSPRVEIRHADYNEPATLIPAFAGVEVLLLVSATDLGQRVPQHAAVIDAARAAGVKRIVYTSTLRADDPDFALAPEHLATENLLRKSGLAFTVLRNSWYIENYTDRIGQFLAVGEIVGAVGHTPFAAATRADFADAAAAAMIGQGHESAGYELGGTPFTMTDLAAAITAVSGTEVVYRNVTSAELLTALRDAGLPEGYASLVVAADQITARGYFNTDSGDLQRLLGRPSTPLADAVRASFATLPSSEGDGSH